MSLGYDRPLYILAFDHRTSFQTKLFGIAGEPTSAERLRMGEAKQIILDGLLAARDDVPAEAIGALTDEEIGGAAARRATSEGIPLAICAEKSSVQEFELEYGDDFGSHVEAFEPQFVKVLVRYNPEGHGAVNRRQAARLHALSDWLRDRAAKFLFELIVPATAEQLARVGGDSGRFADELRPDLMTQAVTELQGLGVEPDIWKVEGLNHRAGYEAVAAAARAGGRDDVGLVVLGAGAPSATVDHWLREAAAVPGYIGFAIGRTIFWNPIKGWLTGELGSDEATRRIADNYRQVVRVYAHAAAA